MTGTILLQDGTVVDGTGAPGERRDLLVVDGRIVRIEDAPADAEVLDASGCVVAPGFIDIHTHYDAQVFWDPQLTPSCYHGVTTVVAGNCGFSIAPAHPEHREVIARTLEKVEDMSFDTLVAGVPTDFVSFDEYLAAVGRRGPGLNFAVYAGHTALRLHVMGMDAYERAATPDEVEGMRALLASALRAGAAGFSTSEVATHVGLHGRPIPSRLAEPAELRALMAEVGAWGRGVIEISASDIDRVADLYALQHELGVPITYAAILAVPSGAHLQRLSNHLRGIATGADVWPQVTPRPLTFAFRMDDPFPLNACESFRELVDVDADARRHAYADPSWRARCAGAIGEMQVMRPRFDTYELAGDGAQPSTDTVRLAELAAQRGVSALEALLDVAAEVPDIWVRAIAANDDLDEVAALLRADQCALGLSDAGAHVGQLCDAPQATDLLGTWVRDRGVLTLEEAVRRLTSVQADMFGFADRGRLLPGMAADVVVFDPETVAPGPVRAVQDFPADGVRLTAPEPEGVRHVLVNGVPIRLDGAQLARNGAGPGQVLAPGPRRR